MQKYYLAIDIGASSGRHIVGWMQDGEWQTEEVYRFPNGVTEFDGHLTWDIESLTEHVKAGIDKARAKYELTSLAIDTWGVDYVLMRGDEEGLPCYVILTREPGEEIRFIHDRMPLMLPEQYLEDWIRPGGNPEEIIRAAQTDMVFEKTV